jgi:predicted TPR repeat methyltransferase/Tfp pilus assembly protein PilF
MVPGAQAEAARQQSLLAAIARQVQAGAFAEAKRNCEIYCGQCSAPAQQAPAQFWLGVIAQRSGDFAAAIRHFDIALTHDKRNAQLLHQAGLAHFRSGDLERAAGHYRNAIRVEPRMAAAHYNLGIVLQQQRDLPAARRAFEAALAHQSRLAPALINLANTLLQLGDDKSAEARYHEALAIDVNFAEAHHGLGAIHQRRRELAEAERHFVAALRINPALNDCRLDLAEVYFGLNRKTDAIACVDAVLATAPANELANELAKFRRAQFLGDASASVPQSVVEKLYSSMASTFDEHLTGRLGYRVPSLLMSSLETWFTGFEQAHARMPNVIDLGCGTGLFGMLVRPRTAHLAGVDLSKDMLELAAKRNVYDTLEQGDVTAYLERDAEHADLIVATDVLIYVSPLQPLFAAASARLNAGGLFAFSTETPADLSEDLRLETSGRFSHNANYIARLASGNGFTVEQRIPTVIRTEANAPIHGFVFVLKKL